MSSDNYINFIIAVLSIVINIIIAIMNYSKSKEDRMKFRYNDKILKIFFHEYIILPLRNMLDKCSEESFKMNNIEFSHEVFIPNRQKIQHVIFLLRKIDRNIYKNVNEQFLYIEDALANGEKKPFDILAISTLRIITMLDELYLLPRNSLKNLLTPSNEFHNPLP